MCRLSMTLAVALASPAGASALAQVNGATVPFPATASMAAAEMSQAPPLTLAEAIRTALEGSPVLSSARREVDATEGARLQAGVYQNPTLTAQIEDQKRETRTTTVLLSQQIELGDKRGARIGAAERATDIAREQLTAAATELRADVTAAFFSALIAQERVRLAQSSLELAGKSSLAAANRVRAGQVSPVEETKAKVAEAGVRLEFVQAEGEFRTAFQRLQSLMARPIGARTLDGNVAAIPRPVASDALEARLRDAPAMRQARLEVRRFAALAELERAKRVPDLTLTAGGMRDHQLGRNQAVIGVSIPLPIFDTNRGNVVEALRRQDKAEDDAMVIELRLRADVGAAFQRYRTALAEVELLRTDILPGAQSAFDAATTGFEFGKFAYLDVLDAQRTLLLARAQHLRALADMHRSASDLDRLLGNPQTSDSDAASLPISSR